MWNLHPFYVVSKINIRNFYCQRVSYNCRCEFIIFDLRWQFFAAAKNFELERLQLCNCTNKKQCPWSIFNQANITANIPGYKEKVYLGVSETTFKVRYGNHKKSFTKQRHKNDMESLKEYWKVKQQNGIPRIKWKVLRKSHAYNQKKRVYLMPK